MPQPPRVLLIAYACAPHRGSEWGLSWNFARELARTQPVWVITHLENRAETEAHLAAHPPEYPIHVHYATLPGWMNWLGARGYSLFNVQYYFWQHAAARLAKRLHAERPFDLVHHVSLVRWWMPSAGAALATRGVPFLFGPVGGGEPMPKNFRGGIGLKARFSELTRGIAVAIWSLDPALRRCVRRASLVLAGTPHAKKRLARFEPARLDTVSSAVTSSPAILDQARAIRSGLPTSRMFRVMSSGGLSYYRGVDLCLRAFAKANLADAEYVHASDGPERPKLEALARELGIADRVRFLGDQPHAENVKALASADVYVHTVLRDSHGLIPDALALGIPVLTLDHNSMALLVDETSGHKVTMDDRATPDRVVDELAATMKRWHDDRALLARLGQGAIARSAQFTAAGRAATFKTLYDRAMRQEEAEANSPVRSNLSAAPSPSGRGLG